MPVTVEQLKTTLGQKGWQPHHIDRAMAMIQDAPNVKSDALRLLDILVYWGALGLAVLGNFVLSIALIPVLLVFSDIPLLFGLGLLAVAFGFIMDVVLREIEHLRRAHRIVPELFIPALALINLYIITRFTNTIAPLMGLPTSHDPWLASIMYVTGFVLPHFLLKWLKK
ncbi:hypothetical protein HY493_03955 [Candidatus Woesearchaeota archaeon]|nr:hypothetical protein [Candidatus Woesearchaeota archaeon]